MTERQQLLEDLQESVLDLRVDLLMVSLSEQVCAMEQNEDVLELYMQRVGGYFAQHANDVQVLSNAYLCKCFSDVSFPVVAFDSVLERVSSGTSVA